MEAGPCLGILTGKYPNFYLGKVLTGEEYLEEIIPSKGYNPFAYGELNKLSSVVEV